MTQPPLHVPVFLNEIVEWLSPRPGMIIADGTLGGGGHTRALAKAVGETGRIIAVDRDAAVLESAERELRGLPIQIAQANFCDLPEILDEVEVDRVDGIVLDLGLSSDQLADDARGFSFESSGPLDLRFDTSTGEPAWRLIDRLAEESLANVIYQYGEERFSRRIARAVVARRRTDPVRTAAELAQLVRRCVPKSGKIDSATRTFQALRIAVNEELKSLELALERLPQRLKPGGRLAIISFHSLEDRRVKQAFRNDPRMCTLTRRPVRPADAELAANPRARSAKLRVAERSDAA